MDRRSLPTPNAQPNVQPNAQQSTSPPGSVVCELHKLRYDPSTGKGCVLCRKVETPSVQVGRYTAKDLVMLGGAAVLGVIGSVMLWRSVTGHAVITHADMASGSTSPHAECYQTCAEKHRECDDRCSSKASAASCPNYCFADANSCFQACAMLHMKEEPPWSFYYATEGMPAWSAVLENAMGVRNRLLDCSDQAVIALAHIQVPEQGGSPSRVAVWNEGMTPEVHGCAVDALREMKLPPGRGSDYEFVAKFDDRYDDLALLIAESEAEIEAFRRLRRADSADEEAVKARLFDARLKAEQQKKIPPVSYDAKLKAAKERVELLTTNLRTLEQMQQHKIHKASGPMLVEVDSGRANPRRGWTDSRRNYGSNVYDSNSQSDEVARQLQDEAERDLERYRSINREYRYREQAVRQQRAWEDMMERALRQRREEEERRRREERMR